MKILQTPGGSSGVPPVTVSDPLHSKTVGDWLKADLTIGNALFVGNTPVVGVVTSIVDANSYVLQTNDLWVTALPGAAGDIMYLQDDGSVGPVAGTIEKAVGVRMSNGIIINTQMLGSGYIPVQNNLSATRAPLATDDSASGYSSQSLWYWSETGVDPEAWRCIDASVGTAVWLLTTLTLEDLGSMATQNANSVSITGGSISGTNITVGTGKTLDVANGTLTLANDQISGDAIHGGTISMGTVAAGSTWTGTTLAAVGTDAAIGLTLTPKGTSGVTVNGAVILGLGKAVVSSNYEIARDNSGINQMVLNVPTGAEINFGINGAWELSIGATNIAFKNNNLTEIGNVAASNNASTLTMNIPIVAPDATVHTHSIQIGGTTGLSIAATGDGAGSVGPKTISMGTTAEANVINIGSATALVSITDAHWSIGETGTAMFSTLTLAVGAAATPSLTFTGDTDTGLYNAAANSIGFAVKGRNAVTISDDSDGTIEAINCATATKYSALYIANDANQVLYAFKYGTTAVGTACGLPVASLAQFGANDAAGDILFRQQANKNMYFATNEVIRITIANDGIITAANNLVLPVGAAATPSLSFTGDTDTGFYNAAANSLGFAVKGRNAVTISDDSDGTITSINCATATKYSALYLANDASQVLYAFKYGTTAVGTACGLSVASLAQFGANDAAGDILFRQQANRSMYFATNEAVKLEIKNDSEITMGQIGAGTRSLSLEANNDSYTGSSLVFKHSSGTGAAKTISGTGATMGNLWFEGYTGAAWRNSAGIQANLYGTVGAARMPSELWFYTSPDDPTSNIGMTHRMSNDGFETTGAVYIGNRNSNGTWRISINGNDLGVYKRESGSYVWKFDITA